MFFIQAGPSAYPHGPEATSCCWGREAYIGEYTGHGIPNTVATAAALFFSLSLPLGILNVFKY